MKKLILLNLLSILMVFPGISQNEMIEWQKSYGGTSGEGSSYINPTSDGGYIFVSSCGSDDGDVSGINRGEFDYWIVKISTFGNIQWDFTFGGTNFDNPRFVQQTNDGGYIVAGHSASGDFDLYDCNHGSAVGWPWDYWIIKLKNNGDFDWSQCYGGHAADQAYSLVQTPDNGFLIAGHANSTTGDITFNHGEYDYWIVKTDSEGQLEWEKSYGGSQWEFWETGSLATSDGGYILGGSSESSDDDVSGNWGDYDIWIVKITNEGNITWEKNYGGYGWDRFTSFAEVPDGGYVVAGTTESHNSGDVGANHGGFDAWAFKISTDGTLEWQRTLGGSDQDGFNGVVVDDEGNYILCGHTASNNGDVSGNHGDFDSWLVKLAHNGCILNTLCLGGTGSDWGFNIQYTDDDGYIVAGNSTSNDGDVSGNHGENDAWIVKLREFGVPDNWGNGIWLDSDYWVPKMTVAEFETMFQEISSHNIMHVYLDVGYFDNTDIQFHDAGDILSGANFQFVRDIIAKAHEYGLLLFAGVGDESSGGIEGGLINLLNEQIFVRAAEQCIDFLDFYLFDGILINFDPLPAKSYNQQVYDKFLDWLDDITPFSYPDKMVAVACPKYGDDDLWWWDDESYTGLFEILNNCIGQVIPKEYYFGAPQNEYINHVSVATTGLINDLVMPYPDVRINIGLPCFPDDGTMHDDDIENLCNGLAGVWEADITNWKNFEGINVFRYEFLHDGSQVCGWDVFDTFGNDIGNDFKTAKRLKSFTGNTTTQSTVDYGGDSDFFTFTFTPTSRGTVLDIKLSDIPLDRNYDLFLYSSAKSLINSSTNSGNQMEEIELADPYGTYYVEVRGITGYDRENQYSLSFAKSLGINDLHENTPFEIYPNPCSGATHLRFKIIDQRSTILDLYNITGKLIKRLINEDMQPGDYEMEVDLSDVPAGIYFCTLRTDDGLETVKLVKY